MKILHTSDWHLGKTMERESLTDSFREFFRQLYRMIDEQHVGAVIIAGDIYDSSVSNAEAIGLYNEAAVEICLKRGCQLIVIAGNHDGAERLSSCHDLLDMAGLHIRGRLSEAVEPVLLDEGRVAVYPVPFCSRAEAEHLYAKKAEKLSSEQAGMQLICDAIRENMDGSRFNILVSHSLVTGYELSDSDHAASIGGASAIAGSVFDGFDYVALGHIHKPIALTPKIRYSGSPLKFCFGEKEEKQTKGVVLIDTETAEQTFVEIKPLHEVRTVQGTLEDIKSTLERNDDYLFLRLTDRSTSRELYEELKNRYPNLIVLRGFENDDSEHGESSITLEEMETMDDIAIMKKFFADIYQYEPTEGQITLFRTAMDELEKGEDTQ